ncbi:DUF481 domain-containing protein [Novosphingobium sp. 1949]|uniref:DUF481 domain-containing protein n=1 Tax=Novosphingobium organovorum TaxID=2930092 RepID=A0ABT0B9U8_9SPHN|nr:DUF481 domain-containing protein [Novosphingobium organovorum]MCJ2181719.1 DUF481 domain-containing protein [Novosphingobium organovorum]
MPSILRSSLVLSLALAPLPALAHARSVPVVQPLPPAYDWPVIVMPDPIPPRPVAVLLPDYPSPVPFIKAEPPKLPETVRAMLAEAMASDKSDEMEAVAKFAMKTQPWFKDEIKAMQKQQKDRLAKEAADKQAAKEKRIRAAGILQLWTGEVDLGGYRNTGNTNNFGVTGSLKLVRTGIKWEHTITATANYQETDHEITTNKYLIGYQPRYTLHEGYFVYGRAQYEKDPISGYYNRYTASGGLGRRLIKNDRMTLSVEIGPALRQVDYVDDPNQTTWSVLTSTDFSWKVNDMMKVTETASAYVGTDNGTFTSLTALEASMTKKLKLKLSYSFEHETNPASDTLKTDTISALSLVYGF